MDLQLGIAEENSAQRDFLRKLKELKRISVSSTKPLYCYGAPQYCTHRYIMAMWQLNSSKQSKFEKPSRDGPNHSYEHISLGKTYLTVTKEQEKTTTYLTAYAQHVEEQIYYADNT